IMLADDAKEKTAFSFKGKQYQFKRVPFGLCTAPQEFQRVMEKILGGLPFVKIYLDDIVIYSLTEEEHEKHVRTVLDRIRKANLRLNKDKCEFGKKEIEFLGFKIADGKKSPNDEKSKIFANFPVPTSKRLLKGFLGLANYVRHLIPDFAELARPLFRASNLKKFHWSDECDVNFRMLKDKLSSGPVVFLPNWDAPFIVTSDASEFGMGAVLSQEINGERKVIEFLSKSFTDTERRYSTIEKEATAILV